MGDPFTAHTGPESAVAFGQVQRRPVVVSGSNDQTVQVWDAATGPRLKASPAAHAWFEPATCRELASNVLAVVLDGSGQAIAGTELGVVCLKLHPVGRQHREP